MIPRNKTAQILKLLQFFPSIGILGPRQVGKTTLVKSLIKHIEKESIYIDLENPKDAAKLNDPILYFEEHKEKCVIIDEIQENPQLFSVLRSLIDLDRKPGRFILLGSASPDLLRNTSESLAGRIAYVELTPFNITEIDAGLMNELWLKGGFPDAFLNNDLEMVSYWHLNYIRTYVERDLPNLGLNVDKKLLLTSLQMLSHIHGDILNLNNLSKSLAISSNTLKRYVNFFEGAFLLRQLKPYYINAKKRLVKSPKIYIRDSGLLHYLKNISQKEELFANPIIGNSWEGFVIEQIIQQLPEKYEFYYYRTLDGAECDLVITKSQQPIMCIEIKYSSSPKLTRGTTIAFADMQAEKNFIITPNSDEYSIKENIRVCNVSDFMTKYLTQL